MTTAEHPPPGRVLGGMFAGLAAAGLAIAVLPAMLADVSAHLERVVGRRSQADLYRATERLDGLARSRTRRSGTASGLFRLQADGYRDEPAGTALIAG